MTEQYGFTIFKSNIAIVYFIYVPSHNLLCVRHNSIVLVIILNVFWFKMNKN